MSGGTPVDNLESSKDYYDGKYEISYTDNETSVSYADGAFTLNDEISTAKLTATLTDKNGCVASQLTSEACCQHQICQATARQGRSHRR